MMKCVFALVLLHACYSVQGDFHLNAEIINNLNTLNKQMKDQGITFPSSNLSVPSYSMTSRASSCLGVFTRELRNLLEKVPAGVDKDTLKKLEANLLALGQQPENGNCKMAQWHGRNIINHYTKFLKKLNNKK